MLAESEYASESEADSKDGDEPFKPANKRARPPKSRDGVWASDSEASGVAEEEDDDVRGWGASRKDYYNADAIETEADALEEEAEARRLQQKQLQGMTEEDYGFDEVNWLEAGQDVDEGGVQRRGAVVQEILPKLEITSAMGPEERLKLLRLRYPEFEPLAKEFMDLQDLHEDLGLAAKSAIAVQSQMKDRSDEYDEKSTPVAALKHRALSAYLATLSMYFAIITSGKSDSDGRVTIMPPEQLRDHSIMETLVQCRDLWEKVKEIPVPDPIILHADLNAENTKDPVADPKPMIDGIPKASPEQTAKPNRRRTKAQGAAEKAQAEADASRVEQLRKTEESFADLSYLTKSAQVSKSPKSSTKALQPNDSDSDFGEQTSLTVHEAAEKAKRKKSLRFYTSQIVQKSNKRDAAGRDAGGDADLPHRERLKDRQARLNAEAEKRVKKPKENSKGDPLGGSSDADDRIAAQEIREASGLEDYYDLVSSKAAARKASKSALAAAHAEAEKAGGVVRIVEEEGEGGKRAITYAIEKNKGLAPKRKKIVRNPRKKGREKFADRIKKLGSTRAIYKGGEGRGGYKGELTGIKKNLIKSVKL